MNRPRISVDSRRRRRPPPDTDDPGLARERTALAWTRSALTMAASGVLIARAAFVGHLPELGVVSAAAMAILVRARRGGSGQVIYRDRREPWMPQRLQTAAFGLLTAATVLIAAIAIVVTIAI